VPYFAAKIVERDGTLASSSDADLEWSLSLLEGIFSDPEFICCPISISSAK